MNKKQISKLKQLGYEDTEESDAILKHVGFKGITHYVWDCDSFDCIVVRHNSLTASGLKDEIRTVS